MSIRRKILVYFSVLSIGLTGVSFILIYSLFSDFRKEEYQELLHSKISSTVKYLAEIEEIDHHLLRTMDKYSINNLYTEKIILFDENKQPIYFGTKDKNFDYPKVILKDLSPQNPLVEIIEEDYDVVGAHVRFLGHDYFGIAKAHDTHGFSKMNFLKNMLIISFFTIALIILISSYYLSRQISRPINRMTHEVIALNPESQSSSISVPDSRDEIHVLAQRFNEMLKRMNEAFAFQRHAVHHISHELKTPIAVLVTNFEKMENEHEPEKLKELIRIQKQDTKNLGDTINALLEIAKSESGKGISTEEIRIDELLYDVIQELQIINERIIFSVTLQDKISSEEELTLSGNKKLLRICAMNLLSNAVQHSDDGVVKVFISAEKNHLQLDFVNHGQVVGEEEQQFLFQHFFRGQNSQGRRGFGLGLVLTHRIMDLHKGKVTYMAKENSTNIFRLEIPNGKQ